MLAGKHSSAASSSPLSFYLKLLSDIYLTGEQLSGGDGSVWEHCSNNQRVFNLEDKKVLQYQTSMRDVVSYSLACVSVCVLCANTSFSGRTVALKSQTTTEYVITIYDNTGDQYS